MTSPNHGPSKINVKFSSSEGDVMELQCSKKRRKKDP